MRAAVVGGGDDPWNIIWPLGYLPALAVSMIAANATKGCI